MTNYRMLNLACGAKVSKKGGWVNVDFSSPVPGVVEMNILGGLDFPDETFDAVYSAQFVEHLTLAEAEAVFRDVYRVMKRGGVLRLVTPDLEELSRSYLHYLDRLKRAPDEADAARYDWIRIELFDQIVRDRSGGETFEVLGRCDEATKQFLVDRIGYTATTFFGTPAASSARRSLPELMSKIKKIPKKLLSVASRALASEATRIGRFRRSGEVHRYVHDEYSLCRLLGRAGFQSMQRVGPRTSAIPDWEIYELDVVGGVVDGPLSLYVEARK